MMRTLFKLFIVVFIVAIVIAVFGFYILDFLFSLAIDLTFLPFYLLF